MLARYSSRSCSRLTNAGLWASATGGCVWNTAQQALFHLRQARLWPQHSEMSLLHKRDRRNVPVIERQEAIGEDLAGVRVGGVVRQIASALGLELISEITNEPAVEVERQFGRDAVAIAQFVFKIVEDGDVRNRCTCAHERKPRSMGIPVTGIEPECGALVPNRAQKVSSEEG